MKEQKTLKEFKNWIEGQFSSVLEASYQFFKFNLCYNIFKIKNILIININLSFSKKYYIKNCEFFFHFHL